MSSAAESANARPRPIVAVIGTTGVGKSQLAVELAQSLSSHSSSSASSNVNRFSPRSGVVLSADSMQLYKGLDVITNKVTKDEMGGVEHWGLDLVQPGEGGSWEVGRWCGEADRKISTLPSDALPIVCGGTHYFIQHFLFPPSELSFDRTAPTFEEEGKAPQPLAVRWTPPCPQPSIPEDLDPELQKLLETFWTPAPVWPHYGLVHNSQAGPSRSSRPTTTEDHELLSLHRLLAAVDAKEAARWHWRDGRKVRRGLERWWERGGTAVSNGDAGDEVASKGRRARFRTLIFWVYEPLETLRPRLDRRVDKMVENGLLREISELRGIAERLYGSADATDHTEGIFQSIGYKEFSALQLPQPNPEFDPLFPSMLARTKLSTHQYAKSQLKWIKKQLLPAIREARLLGGEVEVYVVHGGQRGVGPAVEVLNAFLGQRPLPSNDTVGHEEAADLLACLRETSDAKVPDTADRQQINARKNCEACSTPERPYSVSMKDWDEHCRSKIHKRNANPIKVDKAQWIASQRAKGVEKRAERERLKGPLVADDQIADE